MVDSRTYPSVCLRTQYLLAKSKAADQSSKWQAKAAAAYRACCNFRRQYESMAAVSHPNLRKLNTSKRGVSDIGHRILQQSVSPSQLP